MSDKAFIDTNIFIYLYSEDEIEDLTDGQILDEKLILINIYSEKNIRSI